MEIISDNELNNRIKQVIQNMIKEDAGIKASGENKLKYNDIQKIEALLLFEKEYNRENEAAVSNIVMNQFRETLSRLDLIENKKSQQDASEILGKLISVQASKSQFENEMNKIFGIKYTKDTYCKDTENTIFCKLTTVVTEHLVWISNEYIKEDITYTQALNRMKKEESELTNNEKLNKCTYVNCQESGTELNPHLKSFQKENYELRTDNPYFIIGLKSYNVDNFKNLTKISKNDFKIRADLQIENHELFAFVVHMGDSMQSGHYIAYIKINDNWLKFNDSQKPESIESLQIENLLKERDIDNKINPVVAFYKNKSITYDLSKVPLRGLTNVKNTCYFNSILQILVRIPEYFDLLKTVNTTSFTSSIVPNTISSKKHLGLDVHKVIKQNGGFICICHGTVVVFEGGAIVNAANEGCLSGGGVDAAIKIAGGDDLETAREKILVNKDINGIDKKTSDGTPIRCPTGTATITTPIDPDDTFHNLKCRHVIHAVGPMYKDTNANNAHDQELADAYKKSIEVANENNIQTLAFSLLSSGLFSGERGLKGVLQIAIDTVKLHVTEGMEVYMVGFHGEQYPYTIDFTELKELLEITKNNDTIQLEELPSYKINNKNALEKHKKEQVTDTGEPYKVDNEMIASHDFEGKYQNELNLKKGQVVTIIATTPEKKWVKVRTQNNINEGFVPMSFLKKRILISDKGSGEGNDESSDESMGGLFD